jgi:hypothetical protein
VGRTADLDDDLPDRRQAELLTIGEDARAMILLVIYPRGTRQTPSVRAQRSLMQKPAHGQCAAVAHRNATQPCRSAPAVPIAQVPYALQSQPSSHILGAQRPSERQL